MKTENKIQLTYHLIPTENESCLLMMGKGLAVVDAGFYTKHYCKLHDYKHQHIYLCSGLPIKEEDWVYSKDNNIIFKANKRTLEKLDKGNSSVLKIEFTTDPKLFERWVRHDGMEEIGKFITGVKEIDSNTEAWIEQKSFPEVRTVPFLQTFVTLYNKKYNKKEVDVDELANELTEKYYGKKLSEITHEIEELEADHYRSGIIVGYNKALQSNAGGFSLDDMRNLANSVAEFVSHHEPDEFYEWLEKKLEKYSLTKFQSKGDIIIKLNDGKLYFK